MNLPTSAVEAASFLGRSHMQLLRNLGCASTVATAAVMVLLLLSLPLLLLPAGCLHGCAIEWHVAIHVVMMHSTRLCPRSSIACPTSIYYLGKLDDILGLDDSSDCMRAWHVPERLINMLGTGR